MYLTDIFTISANLAGIPGLSGPCGCPLAGAYNFEQATISEAPSAAACSLRGRRTIDFETTETP